MQVRTEICGKTHLWCCFDTQGSRTTAGTRTKNSVNCVSRRTAWQHVIGVSDLCIKKEACYNRDALLAKAVSWHDFSHKLVNSRTSSWSFPGGADFPTCWRSILVGRIV